MTTHENGDQTVSTYQSPVGDQNMIQIRDGDRGPYYALLTIQGRRDCFRVSAHNGGDDRDSYRVELNEDQARVLYRELMTWMATR